MEWEPAPLNPLQHETEKMTKEHYAKRGCDDAWRTQKRCVEKYAQDPALCQPWIKDWLQDSQIKQEDLNQQ